MANQRVTNRLAQLAAELTKPWPSINSDARCALINAGLAEARAYYDDLVLTDAGYAAARQHFARSKRRNATARARADALRSVGMVRTRYGWE